MNPIYSGLFKLNARDLFNGLVVIVLATAFSAIFAASAGGLHTLVTGAFWSSVLDLDVKAAGLYLSKNLLSDSSGNVLGIRVQK